MKTNKLINKIGFSYVMKIIPIVLVLVLLIGMIPIVDAKNTKTYSNQNTQSTTNANFLNKESPTTAKTSSKSKGDSCLTKLGSDSRKMDLFTKPYLSSSNSKQKNLPPFYKEVVVLEWAIAPEGYVWKVRIIDGSYCLAWNPETRRKVSEIPHTPLEKDTRLIPMNWWKPENKAWW